MGEGHGHGGRGVRVRGGGDFVLPLHQATPIGVSFVVYLLVLE
jgi:hypothetical protein